MLSVGNMEMVIFYTTFIPMGAMYLSIQECSVHSLIRLLYPWVRCIYMQECSVHSLIQHLYLWVQCIYMQYTRSYDLYTCGCNVFTCSTLAHTTAIPVGAMYLPARMFCTLCDTHCGHQF